MSQTIRVAVCGMGAAGRAHAVGAKAAGGFKIAGVADLISQRRDAAAQEFACQNAMDDAKKAVLDPNIDAVILAVPTHLHAELAIAALKSGKHVLIEFPPAASAGEAKAIARAREKSGKVVLYSAARRFGAAEQSTRQAIDKQFIGPVRHVRASLLRTRGVPHGTGWYHDRKTSGGGALIDLGLPLIDFIQSLLGSHTATTAFATGSSLKMKLAVEESACALLRYASTDNPSDVVTVELSVAWAINQPPGQAGLQMRVAGEKGAIDVYTPRGPELYRQFDDKGHAHASALKQPKVVGHTALLRHFRACCLGTEQPVVGSAGGVELMERIESLYKSIDSGKSVNC